MTQEKSNENLALIDNVLDALKARVSLTLLHKPDGIITKNIYLDDKGAIVKDGSQCWLSSGTGTVLNFDFHELPDLLKGLTKNNAIIHGVPRDKSISDRFSVISGRRAKRLNGGIPSNTITRSLSHIEYSQETNNIVMNDYDPPPGAAVLSPGGLVSIIADILPGFDAAAKVVTHSTSSCISDENGNEITGPGAGYHIYYMVPPGTDIARFVEIFKVRAWLAGHGYILISKSGALLTRNALFDEYVFSPERLDFVPGAKIPPGWTQNRPEPLYISGGVFDPGVLPELTADEQARYIQIVDDAKSAVKPESQDVQKEYIKTTAKVMHERDSSTSLAQCEATVRAGCVDGDLYADFIIYPDGMDPVAVGDILINPDKYDGLSCADPFEPENTAGKAMIFANAGKGNGKPVIQTFHHGNHILFLHVDRAEPDLWDIDDATTYIEKKAQTQLENSQKSAIVKEILENQNFDELELDLIRDAIKKHFKINKGAQDSFIKKQEDNGSKEDDLTHIEIAMDLKKKRYPDDQKAVGCEKEIWEYSDSSGMFESLSLQEIEMQAGIEFKGSAYCRRGSDYKHIANYVYAQMDVPDFFQTAPYGLPGATKFYQVVDNSIQAIPYNPTLRQRFKLSFDPDWNKTPTRFFAYLKDTFGEDHEQIELLQECLGALVTGTARKLQRAIMFYGSGENGKSVLLSIITELFSNGMRCSVRPDQLSDDYLRSQISGKVINIVGELDRANAIRAEFKDVLSCDTPITAREIYKGPFTFIPVCGHLFASNGFPQTRDHSTGFYRRWALFNFRYRVPEHKKIPELGKILFQTEGPMILAWALDGAQRLISNDFRLCLSQAHDDLLMKWQLQQDSVAAFLYDDSIRINPDMSCEKKQLHGAYQDFCFDSNIKPLGLQNFYGRILERFAEDKPAYGKRVFKGLGIISNG